MKERLHLLENYLQNLLITKPHVEVHKDSVYKAKLFSTKGGDCKDEFRQKDATIFIKHENQNNQHNIRFRKATMNARKFSKVMINDLKKNFIIIIKAIPSIYAATLWLFGRAN